jgi:hypothetical protein
MKINYILLVLIVLSWIPIVDAQQESLGTFKQGSCISIIQLCNNCTMSNVSSITYPDSTQALGEVVMTKIGTKFNYTFCSTSITGKYIVNGLSDVDGYPTVWAYDLEVNPTGQIQRSILENPFLLLLAILSIAIIGLGIYIKIPWFGFVGGILFMLLGVYTMIYGFNNVTDLYTRGISSAFIGLGLYFTMVSAYEWVLDSEDEGEE